MAKQKYLTNKNLIREHKLSLEQGKPTDELCKMYMMLVDRFSKKPQFSGYSYVDDMKGRAHVQFATSWDKFDHDKSSNPFAYFTQMAKNSFIQVLKAEKKQRDVLEQERVFHGLADSYNSQAEREVNKAMERENDPVKLKFEE